MKKFTVGIIAFIVVFGLTIGAVSADGADGANFNVASHADPGSGGGG